MNVDVLPVLDVFVPGKARPQGSMRSVIAGGRVRTFHASRDELLSWRNAVADAAADLWGDCPLLDEAVSLGVEFWVQRPTSVKRDGKRGRLRPHTTPDLDKLVRAVSDALTGIVFTDDARIVSIYASKHYADSHRIGAHIVCGPSYVFAPQPRHIRARRSPELVGQLSIFEVLGVAP